MSELLLCHYMERIHGIFIPETWRVDFGRLGPDTYVVFFSWVFNSVACPVDGVTERVLNP